MAAPRATRVGSAPGGSCLSASLVVTIVGLLIAGVSALLGVWVERDAQRPPRYAYAISILILLSTLVGLGQAWLRHESGLRMEADLARMLDDLDRLAGRDPELDAYLSEEVRVQARANPDVINALAERVEARGETIEGLLQRRGMSEGDLEALGLQSLEKAASRVAAPPK